MLGAVSFSAPHDTSRLMWFVLPVQPTSKYSLSSVFRFPVKSSCDSTSLLTVACDVSPDLHQ